MDEHGRQEAGGRSRAGGRRQEAENLKGFGHSAAALPLDVRKVSDLPHSYKKYGLRPGRSSDAFKKYGLRIPYDQVLWDNVRIVPQGFLYNDGAAQTLGISQDLVESVRYDLSTGIIKWGDAAATIRGTVYSIIVIGRSATHPKFGGLKTVLIHEFIHSGGRSGTGTGKHDLSDFDGYKEIQEACGGKNN